ncbi:Protein of unknown function [Gryllus bimaculatus]|nr:Protein of unknown function [Gryllus bimaculatus]
MDIKTEWLSRLSNYWEQYSLKGLLRNHRQCSGGHRVPNVSCRRDFLGAAAVGSRAGAEGGVAWSGGGGGGGSSEATAVPALTEPQAGAPATRSCSDHFVTEALADVTPDSARRQWAARQLSTAAAAEMEAAGGASVGAGPGAGALGAGPCPGLDVLLAAYEEAGYPPLQDPSRECHPCKEHELQRHSGNSKDIFAENRQKKRGTSSAFRAGH